MAVVFTKQRDIVRARILSSNQCIIYHLAPFLHDLGRTGRNFFWSQLVYFQSKVTSSLTGYRHYPVSGKHNSRLRVRFVRLGLRWVSTIADTIFT